MHDRIGRELKVGDTVVIFATITELHATDDYCNVSMKTVYGRRPDGMKESICAINTNVLLKATDGESI